MTIEGYLGTGHATYAGSEDVARTTYPPGFAGDRGYSKAVHRQAADNPRAFRFFRRPMLALQAR